MVVRFENCSKKKKRKSHRVVFLPYREKHTSYILYTVVFDDPFDPFDEKCEENGKLVLEQSTRMDPFIRFKPLNWSSLTNDEI